MGRLALGVGGFGLVLAGCQEPPPPRTTPTVSTTETGTTPSTTTSSTTFPTDTTFGQTQDQEPAHWLNVSETGQWTLSPSGGPYTDMSGTLTLQEIVDELDPYVGPDCLVDFALTGTEPALPGTCNGCDPALKVSFTIVAGDLSTCQSPDLPPASDGLTWKMAWHPGDQAIYRNMGGTAIWVLWWPGTRIGDTIDFDYQDSWPIFVEEEEM